MAQNRTASEAWKAMAFIRMSLRTISQPETRAALVIAEASMLALLCELARQDAAEGCAGAGVVRKGVP